MKKLFLAVLISIFLTVPAMAAWTVTAEVCAGSPYKWADTTYMYCYQVNVLSDSAGLASGDHTLSTMLTTAYGAQESDRFMRQIQGNALYYVDYEPGAAPPTTASTITIDKETGDKFFEATVTTAGTAEGWAGTLTSGIFVPLTDVTIAMTTIANAKNFTMKLWFYGGRK